MIEAKKIVVDANGFLRVQRKNDPFPKPMYCPHGACHHNAHCGEHCVFFGDIRKVLMDDMTFDDPFKKKEVFVLSIECGDFANIHNIYAKEFERCDYPDTESECDITKEEASKREQKRKEEGRIVKDDNGKERMEADQ